MSPQEIGAAYYQAQGMIDRWVYRTKQRIMTWLRMKPS